MENRTLADIAEKYGLKISYNEKIAKYTSFGIGGECDIIIRPNCAGSIIELVNTCRSEGIPYRIFGKCSNVLISGKGLRGAVILIGNDYSDIVREGETLICAAGAPLSRVCAAARDAGLSGMEFAYGIPGTVGGGLYMNAGAYGGELKDVVLWCECLDGQGNIKRLTAPEMELSYRHSVFTGTDDIILSAAFGLSWGSKEEISAHMNEVMEKRREKQPLEYPSAGSTFKRPEGHFAAKLIEDSGLKGYTVGGAQVSEKHSGFVINRNNASFEDVVQIVKDIKERVFKDSGIMLECEMLIIE